MKWILETEGKKHLSFPLLSMIVLRMTTILQKKRDIATIPEMTGTDDDDNGDTNHNNAFQPPSHFKIFAVNPNSNDDDDDGYDDKRHMM